MHTKSVKAGRPLAFIVLAFIVGATISQASFAFADDSAANPFRAIWDAIAELQVKTDSLQSQIDDLREQRGASPAAGADGTAALARIADPSIAIEASSGSQPGQTLVQVIGRNSGPENAVGVKLTLYYQTSLFTVNSIQGATGCTDGSRGIIECYLGTIDTGSEARIIVDATPFVLGQQAIFSADISSITEDANPANNHAEAAFITSEAPAPVPQEQTPPPQQPEVQQEQQEEQQPPADSQQVEGEGEQPADQQPAEGQQGEEQAALAEEQEQQQQEQEEQQPGESEEEEQQQPSEQSAPQGGEQQPADSSGSSQPPEGQGSGEGSQPAGGSGSGGEPAQGSGEQGASG